MAETTRRFFEALAKRENEPLLRAVSGTIRCDLADGERTEHWYLTIKRGDVAISHQRVDADCTVGTDLATFEAILEGRTNAMAAVLRGAVSVQGRVQLLIALQALFRPPVAPAAPPVAGYARRPT